MINILYLHAGSEMYGADKVLLELVTQLNKKIFHPIVVLPSEGKLSVALRDNNIETYVVKYPILRRKYFNVKGIIEYVISYKKSISKIYELVRNREINLVHVNTVAVLEGISLRKRLKVPLVWHIHEIIEEPRIIFKVTSFLVGKFSDKVVSVSQAVKNHLIESKFVPENKICTIYNGVDNRTFYPSKAYNYLFRELNIPKDSIRVGMIGRVNAWKGQNDFLKSVSPLLKKHSNLYAIMVGGVFEGEEWRIKQLVDSVKNDPNSDRIRILDFREDTPNMHNFLDIFVLPSTNPDPLPTVVLEAMASGKPIVGYKHGGIIEMVKNKENGLLATPLDFKELSSLIDLLVSDEEIKNRFGNNSLKREQKLFSLDMYISQFSELYLKLVR